MMKKINLKAMNCAVNGNQLYFISSEFNLIYVLNLETNEFQLFDNLPQEKFMQNNLYGNIIYTSGEIFLIPACAENIWIYHIEKKAWNEVRLDENERKLQYKFLGAVLYQEYIYMLGHYYPGIMRLNINTKEIERIELPFLQTNNGREQDGYFNWDYVIKEDWLYLPLLNSNHVLKLNLRTEAYDLISIGNCRNQYSGIVWDGNYFWLPPRKNTAYVRWDGDNEVKEYSLPKEFEKKQYYFGGAYVIGNKVVFSGFREFTLEFAPNMPKETRVLNRRNNFYKKIDNTTVILQDDKGNIFIQKENEAEKKIICQVDDSQLQDMAEKHIFMTKEFKKKELIVENPFISLTNWLNHIDVKHTDNLHNNTGEKIYKSL